MASLFGTEEKCEKLLKQYERKGIKLITSQKFLKRVLNIVNIKFLYYQMDRFE